MDTPNRYKIFRSLKSRLLVSLLVIGLLAYNIEIVKFYLLYRYQCLESAIDAGNGEKLGVCGRRVIDDHGEAIVYDSSDQIKLGQELAARNPDVMAHLSPAWRQAYKTLPLPDLNGDYGYTVTPILGSKHFYRFHWS